LSADEELAEVDGADDSDPAFGQHPDLIACDIDARHVREFIDSSGERDRQLPPSGKVRSHDAAVPVRRRDNRSDLLDA
jgi:hypothetical protein